MVPVIWSPQEDAIILKHASNSNYKNKQQAYQGASDEILRTLHIVRSASACSQRNTKRMKLAPTVTALAVVGDKKSPSMVMNVAIMAIQKLSYTERLLLVDKMLSDGF